jgi:Glycosyl transferases group 1
MIRVTCYIDASQNLYALSKLHTGLCLLAEGGEIEVRFATPPKDRRFFCEEGLTALSVRAKSGEERLAAFDVYDRADVFGRELLERCDLYFKRSYYAAEVARLPVAPQSKIVPFGLNYACRTSGKYVAAIAGPTFGHLRRAVSGGPAALKNALLQIVMIPSHKWFELEPSLPLRPEIVFQTRVWTQADCSTEPIEPLNESRVALVRALRKGFSKHFRGGVIPTRLARERYPDALTAEPTRPAGYLAATRESLIGISTRGLHHSAPYKLPEYLAGSKCVVSEPLRNALPDALEDGRELVWFRGVDECLARCEELLRWPERARDLRGHAWKYYQEHVAPAAHVRKCLTQLLAGANVETMVKAARASS